MVAMGYSLVEGVDYFEAFAPMAPATIFPPWCRNTDAAFSNLAEFVASRAGPRRRVAVPVYSISNGRIVARSPRSAELNLSARLIRPSGECSRAGGM